MGIVRYGFQRRGEIGNPAPLCCLGGGVLTGERVFPFFPGRAVEDRLFGKGGMMKENRIQIVALCCALAVLLSLVAAPLVTAADTGGVCGPNLTWKLDSRWTLTISGTGEMTEYGNGNFPWESEKANIRALVIEDGLTAIPDYAFYGFSSVRSVTIPNSVNSIGQSAFEKCVKLPEVTIPDSVTHMYDSAFLGCYSLERVTLSQNLTSIERGAFQDSNLSSVEIPHSVTSINSYAFYGCTGLKSAVILSGTRSIGLSAFDHCEKLESVTLPETLNSIDSQAFWDCSRLREIYYTGSQEDWGYIRVDDYGDYIKNAHIYYNFPLNATLITLDKTELALKIGGSETLTPTFYPAGTKAEPLRWSSSDSSIAEVTDGKILAKKAGSVTVTAETLDGRISASCSLTVTAPGADGVFRINSVSVLNSDGAELSAVPTGQFLARVSVTNETSSESPLIFFAAYSAEGKYQNLTYAFVDASPRATVSVTLPMNNVAGNIAQLKAFAVTSFAELTPLGNVVSFPAT